jgi:hypothetical protein
MIKGAVVLALVVVSGQGLANAQIIQPVNRFASPGESETATDAAVARNSDDKGIALLTQASAEAVGTDGTQVGLQAIDLWLSRKARLYGRLTLPLKRDQQEEATGSADGKALSENVRRQLVDPYGGLLNLSGGLFARLGKPGVRTAQEARIAKEITTLRNQEPQKTTDGVPEPQAALSRMQPDHGTFLDLRAGIKLIDLPEAGDRAVDVGGSKLNLFYTGIAGLKVILPLYKRAVDGPDAHEADLAGGLTVGAYIVGNHAADPDQSALFAATLKRSTGALTAVIGLNLPGTAGLTLSLTPWTTDSSMGKTFVFGFNVLRPVAPEKP